MSLNQFPQLAEALQRRTLALFVGADLPRQVTGVPSRADLAHGLAHRHGLDESLSLAQVAQRVSRAGSRFEFTDFLRNELDITGKSPQPFHHRLVKLVTGQQMKTLITTAYDNLLELTFQQAGAGINRVVHGNDIQFINPDRPTLIKLYGDAQQPDSLVVTEDDHYGLWHDQTRESVLHAVRAVLLKNTILFLGYNLADPDFLLLWREMLDRAGRSVRPAYGVWPGLPEADVQVWRDRGIVILETDPLGVLDETFAPVAPQISDSSVPEEVTPPSREREAEPLAIPHIDPANPPFAVLRELLAAAFTPEELHRFCQNRPDFRPVITRFESGLRLADMVDRVIEYCDKHLLWDELLTAIAEVNPRQYARFASRL